MEYKEASSRVRAEELRSNVEIGKSVKMKQSLEMLESFSDQFNKLFDDEVARKASGPLKDLLDCTRKLFIAQQNFIMQLFKKCQQSDYCLRQQLKEEKARCDNFASQIDTYNNAISKYKSEIADLIEQKNNLEQISELKKQQKLDEEQADVRNSGSLKPHNSAEQPPDAAVALDQAPNTSELTSANYMLKYDLNNAEAKIKKYEDEITAFEHQISDMKLQEQRLRDKIEELTSENQEMRKKCEGAIDPTDRQALASVLLLAHQVIAGQQPSSSLSTAAPKYKFESYYPAKHGKNVKREAADAYDEYADESQSFVTPKNAMDHLLQRTQAIQLNTFPIAQNRKVQAETTPDGGDKMNQTVEVGTDAIPSMSPAVVNSLELNSAVARNTPEEARVSLTTSGALVDPELLVKWKGDMEDQLAEKDELIQALAAEVEQLTSRLTQV